MIKSFLSKQQVLQVLQLFTTSSTTSSTQVLQVLQLPQETGPEWLIHAHTSVAVMGYQEYWFNML